MIEVITRALLVVFASALLLAFVRLWRGPELEDRVVALDLMAHISVAVAAVLAVRHRSSVYLDVAIVLALIAFIGTVAFARYLEKGEKR